MWELHQEKMQNGKNFVFTDKSDFNLFSFNHSSLTNIRKNFTVDKWNTKF